MKTISIANLSWRAWSPSVFELAGCQAAARVTVAYNGRAWLVGLNGAYGTTEHDTREAAAGVVAKAFADAAASVEGGAS
jgi:hypothetical protein